MKENREQAQTDSACNQERARRRLLQGEEQEERLHDRFGWRLWGMNRIATRDGSPSNKIFFPDELQKPIHENDRAFRTGSPREMRRIRRR